jgi:hypothetical protein
MGWSIGYDTNWERDIGYGVPAVCDHPDCNNEIDRGLYYVCGGEPFGGEEGCGLFFCDEHMFATLPQKCNRCKEKAEPFIPKPDVAEWIEWKLTDDSWEDWRNDNPNEVKILKLTIALREQLK